MSSSGSEDEEGYDSLEDELAAAQEAGILGQEESSGEEEGDGGGEEGGARAGAAGASRHSGERRGDRLPIYDADALHEALEEVAWPHGLPWEEGLVVSGADGAQVRDVEDDLERELAFYTQGLAAAREGILRLEAAGAPWQRPPDYYAEMAKSDGHMARVRAQLAHERAAIEGAEERRKQREAKKCAKGVQAERRKEKAQARKASVAAVTQLRKDRQRAGFQGEVDFDAELGMTATPQGRGGGRKAPLGERTPARGVRRSAKAEAKAARYGFGGPKRRAKQNDAVSAADMEGYRPGRFEAHFGPREGGSRGGGAAGRGRGRGGRSSGGSGGRGGGGSRGPGGPQRGGVAKRGGKGGGRGRAAQKRPGKARRQAARGAK